MSEALKDLRANGRDPVDGRPIEVNATAGEFLIAAAEMRRVCEEAYQRGLAAAESRAAAAEKERDRATFNLNLARDERDRLRAEGVRTVDTVCDGCSRTLRVNLPALTKVETDLARARELLGRLRGEIAAEPDMHIASVAREDYLRRIDAALSAPSPAETVGAKTEMKSIRGPSIPGGDGYGMIYRPEPVRCREGIEYCGECFHPPHGDGPCGATTSFSHGSYPCHCKSTLPVRSILGEIGSTPAVAVATPSASPQPSPACDHAIHVDGCAGCERDVEALARMNEKAPQPEAAKPAPAPLEGRCFICGDPVPEYHACIWDGSRPAHISCADRWSMLKPAPKDKALSAREGEKS